MRCASFNGASDSFLQVNDDGIAFLLADSFSNIRFDWQLVSAVSQGHERAAEWMAVDGAADLDQASSAEECSRVRHLLYQVNAIVPQGVPTGDQVPVVLSVAGQISPQVTMAIQ